MNMCMRSCFRRFLEEAKRRVWQPFHALAVFAVNVYMMVGRDDDDGDGGVGGRSKAIHSMQLCVR